MKCFVSRDLSGIDSIALEERPAPGPLTAGQIRVAMKAASLNYRDILVLTGALRAMTMPELIPLSDGAGEVIEVASDVSRVKVGDRIALTMNPDWIAGPFPMTRGATGRGGGLPGVLCEQMVVHENEAMHLPAHLSFEDGACLPCAGVTAWHALVGARPLMPGMTVLSQGGGGVSLFALQFAKLFGARVIMTTSSEARGQQMRALGADEIVDRTNPDWQLEVRKLTGGLGVDIALDIGGAESAAKTAGATRVGGRVALVGRLTGVADLSAKMLGAGVDFNALMVGSRVDFENLLRAMALHKTKPVIDRRFAFAEAKEALHRQKSGAQFGKIVISI